MGIFGVVHQLDASLGELFLHGDLEHGALAQILGGELRGDKPNAQVVPHRRENHVCGGELNIRLEGQAVLLKVLVEEVPGDGAGGVANPGAVRQLPQGKLFALEMLELLVRIEKVLERTGRAKKVLTVRNILVDMQSHQVYKDGLPVSLKPMEYDLFVFLLQNKNIALGREELLKRVWGENYLGESRTVDVHIGQLRKKLELYDEIRTIPKLGYRLEE